MVQYAIANGIKPAARTFFSNPQTVRMWLRRYQQEGLYYAITFDFSS
jgi:hypothetical protein